MKFPLIRFFLVLMVLVGASIACNFPSSETTPPTPVPTMNTEEAQKFEQQLEETLSNPAPSGEVTLNIDQQELNAFIAAELASGQNDMISDPQVEMANGQLSVYGKVNQSGITANTRIVLQPRVEADGTPKLDVKSVDLGPFPVPDSLKQRVQTMTDNLLVRYLESNAKGFKVRDITITEGQMIVTGTQQQ